VIIEGRTAQLLQWEYHSNKFYSDPFNDIELDILLTSPEGKIWKIPTFWVEEQRWAVRFIPKEIGTYKVQTHCSDTKNSSLHDLHDTLSIIQGDLSSINNLNISSNHKYLKKNQKSPFFWLADTWWMALSKRLSYPDDFKSLVSRRKAQGFNVIMLVAGLFPDMESFDERGSNEKGFPWEAEYTRINPAYFDKADERISYLVESGLIPCILGSWGYYLQALGEKKMKQHWRYIIARWGAYNVVWTIAGEATMPYYLSKQRTKDMYALHEGWTHVARYIKQIEPFGNLITIHPTEIGREQIQEPSLLDFNLIQAGHHGYESVSNCIRLIRQERDKKPLMPLIVGEVNYEGIQKDIHASVVRLTFWSAILSGAKGFSYGANGIWQVNTKRNPFGASPHGTTWGNTPWEEAYLYQGATQIGYAKKLLEEYEWWLLEPQEEWLLPQGKLLDANKPSIAGIPGKLCIIYFYRASYYWWNRPKYTLSQLENSVTYEALFWDPRTNQKYPISSRIKANINGHWSIPKLPSKEDWVLILQPL